jgi:hypothetical protein
MSLTVIRPSEIDDMDRIVSAVSVRSYGRFSSCFDYRLYDDRFGVVYGYYESLGLLGVVRAATWESAYECVQDTIQDDADVSDFNDTPDAAGNYPDRPEGVSYRPNGADPSLPWAQTHYCSEDLNGSALRPLPDRTDDDTEYFLIIERDDDTEDGR